MSLIRRTSDLAQEVADSAKSEQLAYTPNKGNYEYMVSTGSTLLDLAISGGVVRGGGIPGGIMMEIFGPSGVGKTSLMAEICASAQARGGVIKILDPEGRLNRDYCRKFGLDIDYEKDYDRPDTVKEVFEIIEEEWEDDESKVINVIGCDSIAALSTDMEMEKEDKMGGKRAKDFSAGLRKMARIIAGNNKIVVFTNQVRQTMASFGPKWTTPGGEAVKFYSSLRIKGSLVSKLERKAKVVVDESKIIGIESEFEVVKSSIDEPYRSAPIYIIFNYGIDDIRGNLQWFKKHTKSNRYGVEELQMYQSMGDALNYYESDPKNANLLKQAVIDLWEDIDKALRVERKPKIRF